MDHKVRISTDLIIAPVDFCLCWVRVLFVQCLTEDGSSGDRLSHYLQVLFQRGKGGAWIYMIFFSPGKSGHWTSKDHCKSQIIDISMILALFSLWEDTRICSLWSVSLVVYLNYLGASIQSTCFLLVSILNPPQCTVRGWPQWVLAWAL